MGLQLSAFKKHFGNHKNKQNKGAVKEFIAKLSKGLMLPIAMLPVAGLFLGIGSAIAANAGGNVGLETFGNFLKVPGDVIFGALPVLFAIAIAIAFTGDAGPAALAALVGFLVFSGLQTALSVPSADGSGYNLLFYDYNLIGDVFNKGFQSGLPKSLFGSVIGINQLSSSVFGGLLVGFTVAFLYNKFKDIKLPPIIGFFSGVRFIPIVVFGAFFPITIVFLIIWPLFGIALTYIGIGLGQAVGFNSFAFGFIERSLVPFGLHHAFYSPLWYTSVGGSADLTQQAIININGVNYGMSKDAISTSTQVVSWSQLIISLGGKVDSTTVAGDQTMWAFFNNALLGKQVYLYEITGGTTSSGLITGAMYDTTKAYKDVTHAITWNDLTSGFSALGTQGANGFNGVNIGQYLQGKYVFMIFGLPAAAVAMIMAAPKENRKMALSIVASAGFTSMLTGITEPLEFTFLFLAPWLFWGVHAFFCALAFGLMNWIGLIMIATGNPGLAPHIGMSFSGGIIDWVIYGAIQLQFGSNAWWALVFGVAYVPIYYFLFYFLIKKFNIETPGRGSNTKLFSKADFLAKKDGASASGITPEQLLALNVVSAYGGFENIKNVDACITKLRIQVGDQSKVDTDRLMELGARGTIKPSPQSVYAIFGVEADNIKVSIKKLMENLVKDPTLKDKYMKEMEGSKSGAQEWKPAATEPTNSELASEKIVICSPVDGKIVPIDKVPDETFSKEMMGKGIAIEPTSGKFVSPVDGKMSLVFNTKHAYTFETEKGSQILIHIGIDSINLKTKDGKEVDPFTAKVETGDAIKKGDEIADVKLTDLKYAKSKITPIIIMNETLEGREVKLLRKTGEVKKGTPLFEVLPKKAK